MIMLAAQIEEFERVLTKVVVDVVPGRDGRSCAVAQRCDVWRSVPSVDRSFILVLCTASVEQQVPSDHVAPTNCIVVG